MSHRIVLLDTYALPTYIGSPKTFYDDTTDHPVRHLSIGSWPFPVSFPFHSLNMMWVFNLRDICRTRTKTCHCYILTLRICFIQHLPYSWVWWVLKPQLRLRSQRWGVFGVLPPENHQEIVKATPNQKREPQPQPSCSCSHRHTSHPSRTLGHDKSALENPLLLTLAMMESFIIPTHISMRQATLRQNGGPPKQCVLSRTWCFVPLVVKS